MEILLVKQNTDQWLAERIGKLTASSAPSIMGDGYRSRKETMEDFLQLSPPSNHSDFTKKLFKRGHDTEALARPIIEKEINDAKKTALGMLRVCRCWHLLTAFLMILALCGSIRVPILS